MQSMKSYQAALEAALCEQIRLPSVKGEAQEGAPFGKETVAALEAFLQLGEEMGFHPVRMNGYCGYLEWEGEAPLPYVAAVCHLDIVPPGDWKEAFEPQITEDRIIGRGSIDDKGPALACLFAMKALKDEGYRPKKSIRLILGLDEESGSACMKYYTSKEPAPEAAFTADADFPVIFAEKGGLHFGFRGKRLGASPLQSMEAGTRVNVVPGLCEYRWKTTSGEVEEVVVEGAQAHASTPWLGRNAITLAVREIADKLNALGLHDPFIDFYTACISQHTGGMPFDLELEDEASGKLTFNPGVLRMNEEEWQLDCDIRYPVTFTSRPILETMRERSAVFGVEMIEQGDSVPLHRKQTDPLVADLMEVYRNCVGDPEAKAIAIGGGTYARSVPNTVAFGPVFPGEECLCHQTGEYITRDTLLRSAEIYREAFRKLSR